MLSLKENQPSVHRECEALFEWLRGPHPGDQEVVLGYDAQVDGGHGRIETRQVWSTEALEGLGACERWPGLTTVVLVESTRRIADQESIERRYYISSLPGRAETTGGSIGDPMTMDCVRSIRALVQGEDVRGKRQELSHLRVFWTGRLIPTSPLSWFKNSPNR